MKRGKRKSTPLVGFSSGMSLGGKVTEYRNNQEIYAQGEPALCLFFIQSGGVRLSMRTKNQPSAVTGILGVNEFFGELCLAGYPLRLSTAVALTKSTIRTIQKDKMLEMLHEGNGASNSMIIHLLSSVQSYREHVADLLTSSAERRLARVLLRLAHLNKKGQSSVEIPNMSHGVLAQMVGTTRPRINLFMNRFRKLGYIHYDGTLEVHETLRKMLRGRKKIDRGLTD